MLPHHSPWSTLVDQMLSHPRLEIFTYVQFGPLVKQTVPLMEASAVYSFARSTSGSVSFLLRGCNIFCPLCSQHNASAVLCANCAGNAFKVLFDTAGAVIAEYDKEAFISLNKFVDQLPLVLNQV